MMIIDDSFLIGVTAILTSLATLWRNVRVANRAEQGGTSTCVHAKIEKAASG